ncbi:MAG: hypothetical protein A2600_00725 [Candidatus Lambdaproteobacteria bacterium RIFOXYD1_FULL_56_27]|uniref:Uncharacterized protein n=1 Tax=Candidatus Lambdaproteobacteria bacterium RIFOXYD2_FULL_56_26 TaxID=1817773 RepID=A0A1F6GLQ9_9PROT|nr:MAG: hypothetical protein A2557_09795 [Candidatus Lambdaproteobacteria bacterium RIFOXYD2_FULL_56_26]OGH01434.1 MAG: hypothetical protein A2426_08580 [Candidatus Lambdaproteobacteria bacterium RIFOXYC1_FULL_56_13]OGH07079.1 MAG: hypothetical protein A2600_00725 [Candidatus Lambdaproteobacteria bacterium RIFOXYD1_FULL_56_27]
MAEEEKLETEDSSVDKKLEEALAAREKEGEVDERVQLIREVMAKETFIDPLNPEEITKAYALYDKNPQKIIDVLVGAFQSYCRKSIREAALLRIKNQVAVMAFEEAEKLKMQAVEELSKSIQADVNLERLLAMLMFKNHFWTWLRYGLKDIFNDQRRQPGHPINNYLNIRFHKLKEKKSFHTVADLVAYDLTEIVNNFKTEIMRRKVRIFD